MRINISAIILTDNDVAALNPAAGKPVQWQSVFKKHVAFLLLFAYTLLMLKPVMPIITDVLAHTFWEKQHLMTVHEVNGKFHVHYELKNASRQSEKDKQSHSGKFQVDECISVRLAVSTTCPGPIALPKNIIYYRCFYPVSPFRIDSPPPQICS